MNLTKQEKILFARLEARGYRLDKSQEGIPFTFSISPVISAGVDVSIFAVLSCEVISELKHRNYECALSGVVIFPRILDPKIKKSEKLCLFKRKDNAFYVGLEIDFGEWTQGTQQERVNLALVNLQDSISQIPDRHISAIHREQLIEVICVAATRSLDKNQRGQGRIELA